MVPREVAVATRTRNTNSSNSLGHGSFAPPLNRHGSGRDRAGCACNSASCLPSRVATAREGVKHLRALGGDAGSGDHRLGQHGDVGRLRWPRGWPFAAHELSTDTINQTHDVGHNIASQKQRQAPYNVGIGVTWWRLRNHWIAHHGSSPLRSVRRARRDRLGQCSFLDCSWPAALNVRSTTPYDGRRSEIRAEGKSARPSQSQPSWKLRLVCGVARSSET